MKFSLRQLLLVTTLLCILCGLIDNVHRNFVYLGELSGNYTRLETAAYFIGLQGVIAGALSLLLVHLVVRLGRVYYRV